MNNLFTDLTIISGGQTGVDRAALDFAISAKIKCGGWCPRGRKAEDGTIPKIYPLKETFTDIYDERTKMNVGNSDGTLILTLNNEMGGGTKFTLEFCEKIGKPALLIDVNKAVNPENLRTFIRQNRIKTLNIAGNRESQSPGIYSKSVQFLKSL